MPVHYQIRCECGRPLRVRRHHFGHFCTCPKCKRRLFVREEKAVPSDKASSSRRRHRRFPESEVPVHWRRNDLFMDLYRVAGVLGKGGMGVVYKVRHREWDMYMAVKSLIPNLLGGEGWMDFFEQECETWMNLAPHPNTVKCFYVRRMGGIPRLFMEYVRGASLFIYVAKRVLYEEGRSRALRRLLDIAIQVAWGLDHAHEQGVIHQDIKPSNIMVAMDGTAKITDFGLARMHAVSDEDAQGTPMEAMAGTPQFRSPEQQYAREITPKIDMWSWGLTVLLMFRGRMDWQHGHEAPAILRAYLEQGPIHDSIPPMPEGLTEVLTQCFRDDPDERPESMGAVATRLIDLYEEVSQNPYPRPVPQPGEITADVLNNRAVSLVDLHKEKEAQGLWRKALAQEPQHVESAYNQTLQRWRRGKVTDSVVLSTIRSLRKGHESDWRPTYLFGCLLLERGDFRRSEEVLSTLNGTATKVRGVRHSQKLAHDMADQSRRLRWEFTAHTEATTALFLSCDGWRAITGNEAGFIKTWELLDGKCELRFEAGQGTIHAVRSSGDEEVLISGGEDGSIKIWNTRNGRCLKTLQGHLGAVRALHMSADKKTVYSASMDDTIRIWDAASGQCKACLLGHEDTVTSLALLARRRWLLSGSLDGSMRLWDTQSGKCIKIFTGHHEGINDVSAGLERGVIVSASSDGTARVWDPVSGKCLNTFTGHSSPVASIWISEEGGVVLSASESGTLKLWELRSGQCIRTFVGHAPMCLSRDGTTALSCAPDNKVRVWAVSCDMETVRAPLMRCPDR